MFLLWHPSLTAINLSYTFPILETSATALCGTTGIFSGTMVSGIPSFRTCHSITTTSLLNYTSTFIIHGLPPRRMFRKQFEIASPSDVTTPVVPTVESPKNPVTPRDKRRAAGFDAWAVLWWWWCDEGIWYRHSGFKDCGAKWFFRCRVCMHKIHRGLAGGICVEVLRLTPPKNSFHIIRVCWQSQLALGNLSVSTGLWSSTPQGWPCRGDFWPYQDLIG